jgi:hypothetical protein
MQICACHEQHAGHSQRYETLPLVQHTHTTGGGGVVTGSNRDRDRPLQATGSGEIRAQDTCRGTTFDQTGNLIAAHVAARQQGRGPFMRRQIKPCRARTIRHISHMIPSQIMREKGSRQKHFGGIDVHLRLVLAQPFELWSGKTEKTILPLI